MLRDDDEFDEPGNTCPACRRSCNSFSSLMTTWCSTEDNGSATNGNDYNPVWSPDGRTLLYCREDSRIDDLMLVENFR